MASLLLWVPASFPASLCVLDSYLESEYILVTSYNVAN